MELDVVKAKVAKLAKNNNINVQAAWDIFFFDEFLCRLSNSKYKNIFVLKGGLYLQSIVGIDTRSTMDIDLKLMSGIINSDDLRKVFEEIVSIKSNYSIDYKVASINDIKAETKYGGKTIKLEVTFYNIKKMFGIDVGFGDVITPYPVKCDYYLRIHETSCYLWSYSIETCIAEKFETIISKGTNNSRSKDLLDIYLYNKQKYDNKIMNYAVINTFNLRGTLYDKQYIEKILSDFFDSKRIKELYFNYQNKREHAKNITFEMCKNAVYDVFSKMIFKEKIVLKDYDVKLHLVRHGNYNPTFIGGWSDDHLSEEGTSEVNVLLKEIDNDYDVFISSDLNRAIDTSIIINKKLSMNINYVDTFREINTGILNKMTIDEYKKRANELDLENLGVDKPYPGGGESMNGFFDRINNAFIKLLEENRGKKILLVTHGGVITIILCILYGYQYSEYLQISPKTGSVMKFE